eukprot:EG_transcript_11691
MGCRSSKVVIFPCSPDLESTTTTVALRWETARLATSQFDGVPCPPAAPVHIGPCSSANQHHNRFPVRRTGPGSITHPLSALPWAVSQGDSSSCSSGYDTEEEGYSSEGSMCAVAPDSPGVTVAKAAQKCAPRSFLRFSGHTFPDAGHHPSRCVTA